MPKRSCSGLVSAPARVVAPTRVNGGRSRRIDRAAGFKGRAPSLIGGNEAISLEGNWEFRLGDDEKWAKEPLAGFVSFEKIGPPPKLTPFATVINRRTQDQPLSAEASRDLFKIADDLEVDLVLSEPTISQPLFMMFDERGRLWVLNYLQYPEPAGLTLTTRARGKKLKSVALAQV